MKRGTMLSSNNPNILSLSAAISNYYRLTQLEIDILSRIANGQSTKGIAEAFNLSDRAVTALRRRLIRRFHAQNGSHLVALAVHYGIVTPTSHSHTANQELKSRRTCVSSGVIAGNLRFPEEPTRAINHVSFQ